MAEEKAKKIVLIDDEPSFCEMLSFTLKKHGFDVNCYTDPKEALLKIVYDKPDVILLDLLMPELNGFSVLEHIKQNFKGEQPKILIVTNLKYTDSGVLIDEKFCKSIGADGVIHKTGDLDDLIKKIKELL